MQQGWNITHFQGLTALLPDDSLWPGACGAPGRIRTCNPRIRNPMLYPVELRALFITVIRH